MRESHYSGRVVSGRNRGGGCFKWIWIAPLAVASVGYAQVPSPPNGLTATTISATQINLAWNDTSGNEQGFVIEQSLDSLAFSQIGSTVTNIHAFSVTNLYPNSRYYYRVRSFNGSGNSAPSSTNLATTQTPFTQWQMANFTATQLTNPAVSGPGADPDGDHLPNIFESAFGRAPQAADATNLAAVGIDTDVSNQYLAVTYARSAAALDVRFGAAVSSDLTTWSSGTDVVTGPIPVATNGALVTEKFRASTPLGQAWQQFMRLAVTNNGVPNSWESGPAMPVAMCEVASAVLSNKLYVFGVADPFHLDTNSPTQVYDLTSKTWTNINRPRPFVGHHHGAEVVGGRLYLIGGLDGGSSGKVQIYDPATNGWSLGAPMPFAAGSCGTAVINDEVYAAGGIVGLVLGVSNGTTTNAAAKYNPASNVWTVLAPMPVGRNHAAVATDGSKLYVFAGRDAGNDVANGYNNVQIYDPASNTWAANTDPGSPLKPVPQSRGGMGKAVYCNGDFYVMGGETQNGTNATPNFVYNCVNIYNAASNSWRLGPPMLTARHGIYPVLANNRIYVVSGGTVHSWIAGPGDSAINEAYIVP